MRHDETFVMDALAKRYGGCWVAGEDPPDAYLTVSNEKIAVEVSMLTQQIIDAAGSRSRLSEDATALNLANTLNAELNGKIPEQLFVMLLLRSPIAQLRKTQAALADEITKIIADGAEGSETDRKVSLFDNDIEILLRLRPNLESKCVVALITNKNSGADIVENARLALEDRIVTKAKKCSEISRPIWLALFNDYWLAENSTYKYAMSFIECKHQFSRIVLVSGSQSVELLFSEVPEAGSNAWSRFEDK